MLKAIIMTLILATSAYVCFKVVPVLFAEYQFQDNLQTVARFASVNRQTPAQIKATILDDAQKAELPVNAEDIKVSASSGNVHIDVDYSVTLDLSVYQWTMNFHPSSSNSSLF